MRILGISCYFHDAAAVLLENGMLIAAAEEERFTRKKHDFDFPRNAIRFCLQQGMTTGKELDYVVFFEKPFTKFDRILRTTLQGFPKTSSMFVQSMRAWMMDKLWVKSLIAREVGIEQSRILFAEHHLSHAASSYFCSPFDEAAVLTFDGVGEWSTTTMGVGKGPDLTLTQELHFPHSIGMLYSTFTAFLGFEVNEGEYKVMGMAPYGVPRYVDLIWKVIQQNDDASFWLDPRYFSFQYSTTKSYTQKFLDLFGKPRDPDVPFVTESSGIPSYYDTDPRNAGELYEYNQKYADIAASIQAVTEDLIIKLVRRVHEQTGLTKLCLAGGVALNSAANGRILRETPIEELYVQPSAGDGGGALGAALYAWHCALGNTQRFVMDNAYWGQSYESNEIKDAIDQSGMRSTLVSPAPVLVEAAVERLLQGRVVAWFQGRFEWGPRALGHRSILADPRQAAMKDTVNNKVKFREPFRPFAPSVLAEATEQYFVLPDADQCLAARFMLLVVPVRQEKQDVIQAVNHMGTSRVQTVYKNLDPLYHDLIDGFGQATGVPLLLNTSFNVRGEPIVNSPEDALRTFNDSGIDSLIIGNHVLDKT